MATVTESPAPAPAAAPSAPATTAVVPPLPTRIGSVDAYRGFVMLLLMGEVLRFCETASRNVGSAFWAFLCLNQDHVEWTYGWLHDLIQPSFSFLVGVALPFSLASRSAAGQPRSKLVAHAFWRALILVFLGVWLRSVGKPQTYFTFEDTLSQIGLGYGFLFLLAFRPVRDQWIALTAILVGYWAAFVLYPLPPPNFDYAAVGVPADWGHLFTGFQAHWNKNSNLAWAFDTWFLNLFPRESPFLFNGGGYSTLSFIPTLGTMILGLIAGGVLRSDRTPRERARWLAYAGLIALAAGTLLGELGICPVVKRIWTPSFTLWSGGLCFLFLASFYHAIDILGHRKWAFFLIVIGMNSIAAYCIHGLFTHFLEASFLTHFGAGTFAVFGERYEVFLLGVAVLALQWAMLYWMYKRRIFLRI